MTELKIIKGNLKEEEEKKLKKRERLKATYQRIIYETQDPVERAFIQIKYFSKFGIEDLEDIKLMSNNVEEYKKHLEKMALQVVVTKAVIGMMTISTFIQLFPIKKTYDGEKYVCKDYYQTIKMLKSTGLDFNKYMILDQVDEILAEYWNDDILGFNVFSLMLLYRIDIVNNRKPLFDKWLEENGVQKINKIADGVYLESETGKILKETSVPAYTKEGNVIRFSNKYLRRQWGMFLLWGLE